MYVLEMRAAEPRDQELLPPCPTSAGEQGRKPLRPLWAGLLAVLCLMVAGESNAARRSALVIGNATYTEIGALTNPLNDARDVAAKLRSLDFDVTHAEDLDQRGMEKVIREFGRKVRAVKGDALFYYAGHGVERDGRNFLIPLRAGIEDPEDLRYKAVDVGQLLSQLESARNGVNIIILDACRNNPYENFRGIGVSGLASMTGPTGSLIAFATSPGDVAADGKGRNGIFTKHLLSAMGKPGASLDETFRTVRRAVATETDRGQIPWSNSSVIGDFYFTPPGGRDTSSSTPGGASRPSKAAPNARRSSGNDRLSIDDQGAMRDSGTGLAWQCTTGRSVYSHKEAESHAREESAGGATWKLPSAAQLRAVIDAGAVGILPGLDDTSINGYWLSKKNIWLGSGQVLRFVDGRAKIEKRALSSNAKACLVSDR